MLNDIFERISFLNNYNRFFLGVVIIIIIILFATCGEHDPAPGAHCTFSI